MTIHTLIQQKLPFMLGMFLYNIFFLNTIKQTHFMNIRRKKTAYNGVEFLAFDLLISCLTIILYCPYKYLCLWTIFALN